MADITRSPDTGRISIPDAVVEAVAVAEWDAERARIEDFTLPLFEELHPVVKKLKLENARAACLAMLEAWPGMEPAMQMSNDDWTTLRGVRVDALILPLTQEASDDKA